MYTLRVRRDQQVSVQALGADPGTIKRMCTHSPSGLDTMCRSTIPSRPTH